MTEIIMYRNPLEAAVWGALMNGDGSGVMIFLFVLAMGLLWAGVYVGYERVCRWYEHRLFLRDRVKHVPTWMALPRWLPGPGMTATFIVGVVIIVAHLYNVGSF